MKVCVVLDNLAGDQAALAAYAARALLRTLGVPHEVVEEAPRDSSGAVIVWHGGEPPQLDAEAVVAVPAHELPAPEAPVRWLARVSDGKRVACVGELRPVCGEALYVAEGGGEPMVAIEGSRVNVGADIFGAAGFWLTCRDEAASPTDGLGRRLGRQTPRAKAGLLRVPVVTELMNLLWEAIQAASRNADLPLVRVLAWPPPYRFAALLSHDVDLWRKRTPRQLAKELLRSVARPWRLGWVARAFVCGPDPWADLEGIAALEEAHQMHSTFFVLAGRPDVVAGGKRVVNGYPVPEEVVSAELRRLAERGFEVALHGSFESFHSAADLSAERRDVARLIGQAVSGCRQHFLRFELPRTWRCQAEAGLRYDASLGYHDTDGYRAGFSFPFWPFDGEEVRVLELPLMVMDGALREQQGLDAEAAWEVVRGYLERAEADGAMVSLLWHNHYFCGLDAPGYRAVYERALEWIRDHGGWGASADSIARWWLLRTDLRVDSEPERARFRVSFDSYPAPAEVALEIAGADEVSFEACSGRASPLPDGATLCILRDVRPGQSSLFLRRARTP